MSYCRVNLAVVMTVSGVFAATGWAQVPQPNFPVLSPGAPPIQNGGSSGVRSPGQMTTNAFTRQNETLVGVIPNWDVITEEPQPSPFESAGDDAQLLLAQQAVLLVDALVDAWLTRSGIDDIPDDPGGGDLNGGDDGGDGGEGDDGGDGRDVRKVRSESERALRIPSERTRSSPTILKSDR